MANTTSCPIFQGIIYSTEDWSMHPKKLKTKSKSKAGAVRGMTRGEKERLSEETEPVNTEISVEEVSKEKLNQVDPMV